MASDKKVVVVGAGPGGYVSAIRAAQLGADVTVIEENSLGGVCLNAGCIPTKTLLASVEVLLQMRDAKQFGVNVEGAAPDFPGMVARKERIVSQLVKGIEFLFGKNGIKLVKGKVTGIAPGKIAIKKENDVEEEMVTENIIIATGSLPAKPAVFQFDGERVITSTEILRLKEVPDRLLVIGGGAIGVEFAYIFSALGTDVSVVEQMDQLLPGEDSEIAALLEKSLKQEKIDVYTGSKVESLEIGEGIVSAKLSSGDVLKADKVLVAVGRVPNTKHLGIEKMGILDERGFIKVNERMETSVGGIYAIGDAVGGMLLAHKASHEGIVAAENAVGSGACMQYDIVPRCIFTQPEVAAVGISENTAKERGREVKIGKFPFKALGKAWAIGKTEGMVKIIADASSGEILGVFIIGPQAADLIGEAAIAMKLEGTAEDIVDTIHAHPTLSEAIMEASHSVFGKAIHT